MVTMFALGVFVGASATLAVVSAFSLVELILEAQDGVWE